MYYTKGSSPRFAGFETRAATVAAGGCARAMGLSMTISCAACAGAAAPEPPAPVAPTAAESAAPPPTPVPALPSPVASSVETSESPGARSAEAAAWVPFGIPADAPVAFSANGGWYALLTSQGLVLGDSSTWQPLSMVHLNIDKPGEVVFDPASGSVVATYDFALETWAIRADSSSVALTLMEPPLPWGQNPGLDSLAFDRTGRYLAVGSVSFIAIYDYPARQPLVRLRPSFHVIPSAIGFSRDEFFAIQPTTQPCQCDDFGGSDALVASWRTGSQRMTTRRLQGDVGGLMSLRGGILAAGSAAWSARTGKRVGRTRIGQSEVVLSVYRLRMSQRWIGLVYDDRRTPQQYVALFGSGPRARHLADAPDALMQTLSARPQDDLATYLSHDHGAGATQVHTVSLSNGAAQVFRLPVRLCVRRTRVLPESECADAPEDSQPYARAKPAPALDLSQPPILAPEPPPQPARRTRRAPPSPSRGPEDKISW